MKKIHINKKKIATKNDVVQLRITKTPHALFAEEIVVVWETLDKDNSVQTQGSLQVSNGDDEEILREVSEKLQLTVSKVEDENAPAPNEPEQPVKPPTPPTKEAGAPKKAAAKKASSKGNK